MILENKKEEQRGEIIRIVSPLFLFIFYENSQTKFRKEYIFSVVKIPKARCQIK